MINKQEKKINKYGHIYNNFVPKKKWGGGFTCYLFGLSFFLHVSPPHLNIYYSETYVVSNLFFLGEKKLLGIK